MGEGVTVGKLHPLYDRLMNAWLAADDRGKERIVMSAELTLAMHCGALREVTPRPHDYPPGVGGSQDNDE